MNTHDDGRMSRMPEPWELEQDEYSFMARGLQCLLLRNDVTLTWSGLAEIRLVRYLHPAQRGAMDRALRAVPRFPLLRVLPWHASVRRITYI